MARDSLSATISISPKVAFAKYAIQSLCMLVIFIISVAMLVLEIGNANFWQMLTLLSFVTLLNIPVIDILQLLKDNKEPVEDT